MRATILVIVFAGCCLAMTAGWTCLSAPAPDPNRGWVDYDNLNQTERLKERPGNYQALATITDFLDGIHQVRPAFRSCAYPLQLDRELVESAKDMEKGLDDLAEKGANQNKLRKYNIRVRSLSLHNAERFGKSLSFKKLHESERKRFAEVRKRHPGRAVVALVHADLESLRSPKVEADEDPYMFYLVWQKGRWLVVWYNRP
jgi:hypothetical protein